jgi:hypothetical protein
MAGHSLVDGTRGEATVVDLGKRGLLFALLIRDKSRKDSYGPGGYEYAAFSDLNEQARSDANGNEDKRIAYFIDSLNRLKPSGDISPRNLSLMVRFRDVNDPRTVERIDPENLAASFGAGVWLKRATIEIVDEPLTTGIEKRLPWLDGFASTRASLDGDTSMARYVDAPLANELDAGKFRSGM